MSPKQLQKIEKKRIFREISGKKIRKQFSEETATEYFGNPGGNAKKTLGTSLK